MESQDDKPGIRQCLLVHWRGVIISVLPLIFLIATFINDTLPFRCLYVIISMFICWLTEIFPFAITAMFPIVAFPLMNILSSDKTCSLYFKETLVMFIISIMIALTMEFTNLHTRLAINIIKFYGSCPRRLHLLLVVVTAFLSMLIPNAACVALMYPLTNAILDRLSSQGMCKLYEDDSADTPKTEKKPSKLAICFYLSVAYASSMGGSANLMGTPANLEFIEVYEDKFPDSPDDIDFGNFLSYALPQMIVYTGLMYLVMEFTHMGLFRSKSPEAMALRFSSEEKLAAQRMANDKYEENGSINVSQCITATLIIAMICMIFTREPEFSEGWGELVNGKEVLNASVTTIIIFLIFSLPAKITFLKCWDVSSVGTTPALLNWKFVNSVLPWNLVFIIGCGGAIAEGCKTSGFQSLLGDSLSCLKHLPAPLSLLIAIIFMEICTNLTVNAAVISVIAPGVLQLAAESKAHPLYFMFPVGLAGSMAFLMPSATAPNALMAAYANIKPCDMIFVGFSWNRTIYCVSNNNLYFFTKLGIIDLS
ncbi:protein I'm not dead yet-like isoform X2 [Episyrphus balteatus]|uniref:protein I'm not dead yet-like isoform X2 n=1 Tax=Episyrphus balteatus TaxID=286459 RepID=UPI002485FFB3|nr:protein I'm not dead yet-like isoform X2 [Episyrphus balteatus]